MRPTLQEYALNLHPGDVVAISNGKFGHDLGVFRGYSFSGNAQIEIPVPVSIKSYRTKPYVKTVLPNHKRRIVKVNLSDLPLEEVALLEPLSIKYKQN